MAKKVTPDERAAVAAFLRLCLENNLDGTWSYTKYRRKAGPWTDVSVGKHCGLSPHQIRRIRDDDFGLLYHKAPTAGEPPATAERPLFHTDPEPRPVDESTRRMDALELLAQSISERLDTLLAIWK